MGEIVGAFRCRRRGCGRTGVGEGHGNPAIVKQMILLKIENQDLLTVFIPVQYIGGPGHRAPFAGIPSGF